MNQEIKQNRHPLPETLISRVCVLLSGEQAEKGTFLATGNLDVNKERDMRKVSKTEERSPSFKGAAMKPAQK